MRKLYTLLFVLQLPLLSLLCQINPTYPSVLDDIVPPSPSVSAFMKHVDVPVGLYTGIPEISIPLTTVSGFEVNVPVSVQYHGGGVKVEEASSIVGQGWSLNAGGVISRIKRGRPDEIETYGFFDFSPTLYGASGYNGNVDSWVQTFFSNASHNDAFMSFFNGERHDVEPDIFTFSFPGGSGKFVYNPSTLDFSVIPLEQYKIEIVESGNSITGWIITDKSGIEYHFSDAELTTSSATKQSVMGQGIEMLNTSWHLSEIKDNAHNESIYFTYYPFVEEKYDMALSESISVLSSGFNDDIGNSCGESLSKPSYSSMDVNSRRLSKIESNRSKVLFSYQDGRPDYRDRKGSLLTSVSVQNKTNREYYGYTFKYDTISSTLTGCDTDFLLYHQYLKKRIFLDEIEKFSTEESLPPYKFTYNSPSLLPARNSAAQDYWGFYNGESNTYGTGRTLIPGFYYMNGTTQVFRSGAIRLPDSSFGQYGILTSIEYPEGGVQHYEYEPHSYGYVRDIPNQDEVYTKLFGTLLAVYKGAWEDYVDYGDETFVVDFDQEISLNYLLPCYETGYCSVYDSNGTLMFSTTGVTSPYSYFLHAGTYTVKFSIDNLHPDTWPTGAAINISVSCDAYSTTSSSTYTMEAGGARVRSTWVTDENQIESNRKYYEYTCREGDQRSSGALAYDIPSFNHNYEIRSTHCLSKLVVASNVSISQSGTTNGSHVGYSEVTVFSGEVNEVSIPDEGLISTGENGSQYFKYTSPIDKPDAQYTLYPQIIGGGNSWRHGKLLEHEIYSSEGLLIEQTLNEYKESKYNRPYITGHKFIVNTQKLDYISMHDISRRTYYTNIEFDHLLKTTHKKIFYDDLGNDYSQIRLTEYAYDDSYNLNLTKKTEHNGHEKLISRYKYASGYQSTNQNDDQIEALNLLYDNHNLNALVEQQKKHSSLGGAEKQIGGTILLYNITDDESTAFPSALLNFESDIPTVNGLSSVDNGYFDYDNTYYKDNTEFVFNNTGRMLNQTNTGGDELAIIYGYNTNLLIARATNATYNEVYFTSFEDEDFNEV